MQQGPEFVFPHMIDQISHLRYCSPPKDQNRPSEPKYIHAVWAQNDPPGIYMATSSDAGASFSEPAKIIGVNGNVKEVRIIAKDDDFVVTLLQNESGRDSIQACTGKVNPNMSYALKPCERVEAEEGKSVHDYQTVWEGDHSTDYIYVCYRDKDGTWKCSIIMQIHCTRLSVMEHTLSEEERLSYNFAIH